MAIIVPYLLLPEQFLIIKFSIGNRKGNLIYGIIESLIKDNIFRVIYPAGHNFVFSRTFKDKYSTQCFHGGEPRYSGSCPIK